MKTAIALGVVLGIVYALSPLTVWFVVAAVLIVRWAEGGLHDDERRWVRALLIAAIVARVLAVLALFAITDHAKVPFSTFFGDEDFFIKRSIWLRNLAIGVPIHSADMIYSFDDVGMTSYLYVLAWLQMLVGPSPYGVHLVGVAFYLAAVVLLFRLTRRTLGRAPAMAGLALLLFLPSLFAWSVSALKESAFLLLSAGAIAAAERLVRERTWLRRAAALAVIVGIVVTIDSVRRAGGLLIVTSVVGGLAVAGLVVRPKALLAAIAILPIAAGIVLSRPAVQVRAYEGLKTAAWQHRGHIYTPGYVYKTLDERFYISERDLDDMRFLEGARFVTRSMVDYVIVPLPWRVESSAMRAYVPEQIVWYLMVAALPFGFVSALRRDALVASLLLVSAVASALLIALVSGNIGTLVRHRGLIIPLIVWLSAVGCFDLLRMQTKWR